ncbi:MAG: radical SAM protein [Acidobacteriota bacterium]
MPVYVRAWKGAHGTATTGIMASRGCPFRCNWCSRPIFGNNFRLRPVDPVIAEMRGLIDRYGVDHFWFFDDSFVVKQTWVEELCVELKRAGMPASFECMARVDQVSEKILRLMKDAGCSRITYGVESGSQKVLDAMEKGTKVDQVRRTADWMHALGIQMGVFIMYGYPGEEYPEILETLDLIRRIQPDQISMSVVHPMPGTGFYENVSASLSSSTASTGDYHEGTPSFRTRYPGFFYKFLKKRTDAGCREARQPGIANSLRVAPWRAATALLSCLCRDRSRVDG